MPFQSMPAMKEFRKRFVQKTPSNLPTARVNQALTREDKARSKSVSYNVWLKDLIRKRVHLILRLGITSNSAYALIAPALHLEQSRTVFLIHGAITLGLLACLALHRSRISNRYPDLLIVGVTLPLSLGYAHGTAFFDGTVYYIWTNLTLFVIAVLIPVRWRTHALAQLGTLAYFLGVHAGLGWTAASWNVVFQTFTLLCTCVLCNFCVYVHERLQRREVNARRKLEAANTKLHELNHQLQKANLELQSLASLDSLTQVANRRSFEECLNQEWRRMAREKAPLSLILCDVDFFKTYNDTYGHQAGDICLQQVAKVIKSAVKRPADLVARYGGEEFVVILPHTRAEGAVYVAEQIRAAVKALKIAHTNSQIGKYVTLSLGVASSVPSHKSSPATLIAAADQALYQAKAQGRDRVILLLGARG